jgi:membrane protein required for colicin V production
MSTVDIVLFVLLGIAGFRGFQRGFIVSLLSLLAFWIGIVLAFMFLDWGVQILDDMIEGFSGVLPYLAFLLIFAAVGIGIGIVAKVVKKSIDLTPLGIFDNFAGGLLAILTWVFGISLLIWLTGKFGVELPSHVQDNSILFNKIETVAPAVIDMFAEYLPFLKHLFESIAGSLSPDAQ